MVPYNQTLVRTNTPNGSNTRTTKPTGHIHQRCLRERAGLAEVALRCSARRCRRYSLAAPVLSWARRASFSARERAGPLLLGGGRLEDGLLFTHPVRIASTSGFGVTDD
jgi:hypothetical protein